MSDSLNLAILTKNYRAFVIKSVQMQLDQTYVAKDGSAVTGRNLNEMITDMRAAGFSMPGTDAAAHAYFTDLGFRIATGFRKEGSGARYGAVVVEATVELPALPVTMPDTVVGEQVWERELIAA